MDAAELDIDDLQTTQAALDVEIAAINSEQTTQNTNIATNTADILTNTNSIALINLDLTTQDGLIALNTTDIATNANDIALINLDLTTQDGLIALNITDITANANDIALINLDLATQDGLIALNTTDIATNANAITQINLDLVTQDGLIALNTTDIATNANDIALINLDLTTQDGLIALNITDITTNANDIALINLDLATLDGLISLNAADIVTNTNAITSNTNRLDNLVISDATDVNVLNPTLDLALLYNDVTQTWENKTITINPTIPELKRHVAKRLSGFIDTITANTDLTFPEVIKNVGVTVTNDSVFTLLGLFKIVVELNVLDLLVGTLNFILYDVTNSLNLETRAIAAIKDNTNSVTLCFYVEALSSLDVSIRLDTNRDVTSRSIFIEELLTLDSQLVTNSNVVSLNDLDPTRTTGDVIKYNGVDYEHGRVAMNELNDVDTTGITDGLVLAYSSGTLLYLPTTVSGGGGGNVPYNLFELATANGGNAGATFTIDVSSSLLNLFTPNYNGSYIFLHGSPPISLSNLTNAQAGFNVNETGLYQFEISFCYINSLNLGIFMLCLMIEDHYLQYRTLMSSGDAWNRQNNRSFLLSKYNDFVTYPDENTVPVVLNYYDRNTTAGLLNFQWTDYFRVEDLAGGVNGSQVNFYHSGTADTSVNVLDLKLRI